jgi:RNA polymerase sporulation-specific sigma factor
MKFEILTDEELVKFAQGGDSKAMDFLLDRYKYMVKGCARGFFLIGGDNDDLLQEGMRGLFNAITNFDSEKSNFKCFAHLCIARSIKTAIKLDMRQKNRPLNSYISIYNEDGGEAVTLYVSENPEDAVIKTEEEQELLKKIKNALTNFEINILKLYLNGLSYSEMSVKTGKNEKSIDNALHRARAKLKKVLY